MSWGCPFYHSWDNVILHRLWKVRTLVFWKSLFAIVLMACPFIDAYAEDPPRIRFAYPAVYPQSLWLTGESGSVLVGVQVDYLGRVVHACALHSSNAILDPYAIAAAKLWVFEPIVPDEILREGVWRVLRDREVLELESANYLERNPGIVDSLALEWMNRQAVAPPLTRFIEIPFSFNY